MLIGIRELANHLGFSKDTVFRHLKYLCERDTIRREGATEGTVITILKYDQYQSVAKSLRQSRDTDATGTGHDSGRQPNACQDSIEALKKISIKYTPDFESLWRLLPRGIKDEAHERWVKLSVNERQSFALSLTHYIDECDQSEVEANKFLKEQLETALTTIYDLTAILEDLEYGKK